MPDATSNLNDAARLSAQQAQQLVAACPALGHVACCVGCESVADVATACITLPSPLALHFSRTSAAARMAALLLLPTPLANWVLQHWVLHTPSHLSRTLQCFALLAEALPSTTLTTLTLDGIVVAEPLAALCEALRMNATLTTLLFTRNGLGDSGGIALSRALHTHATLKTLMITRNTLGDASAAALGAMLHANAAITTLNLASNRIGDAGVAALSTVLQNTNASLTTLVLDGNHISVAGATALGEMFRRNATLTTLSLNYNDIQVAGATALAEALRTNSSLTSLPREQCSRRCGRDCASRVAAREQSAQDTVARGQQHPH